MTEWARSFLLTVVKYFLAWSLRQPSQALHEFSGRAGRDCPWPDHEDLEARQGQEAWGCGLVV